MDQDFALIRRVYLNTTGDSDELFETILALAPRIGLERALAHLEQCVTEKRLAWLARNLPGLARSGDPISQGYHLFYETYLHITAPPDGEIVARDGRCLVARWWNACPTLAACQKFGLDTRVICKQVYHRPVQAFLSQIHPGLRFERNYAAIRPHQPYCEEIIRLVEDADHPEA